MLISVSFWRYQINVELFTIWFTMEALTSNGSIFLWRKHRWQLETTSNSHTYWRMSVVTDERQKQWSRDIMLHDTADILTLFLFEHLRERLFGMEESAEERIGRSTSTSCTTATWRTTGHLRPTFGTRFGRCDGWKMHWMVLRYSPFHSKVSTARRLLAFEWIYEVDLKSIQPKP